MLIRNKHLNILLVFILISTSLAAILFPLFNLSSRFPLGGSQQDRSATQLVEAIFGNSNAPKRTLVLLANNNEIRVGGGFVGTVGLLRGDGKKITLQEIRSVYYYDHRIEDKGGFIDTPEYMNRFATDIRLANSLWHPLTKVNLTEAHDIYARETGVYVDNVVEITPDILKKLLQITGPIWLQEYEKEIRADNLLETIQLEVEAGKDRTISGKDPKSILGALNDALLVRVFAFELEKTRALAGVLKEAASGSGLRALLGIGQTDRDLPRVITNSDESAVGTVNSVLIAVANLDAGKGSGLVQQENTLKYKLSADGTNILNISVTRRNTADKKLSYIDPRTGGGNDIVGTDVSSLQMFLPRGAVLSEDAVQTGGTLGREALWAVYRQEMMLPISSESSIAASFDIPKADNVSQSIVGVKHILFQFGAVPQRTRVEIQPPAGYRVSGANLDSRAQVNGNTIVYDLQQSADLKLPYKFEQQ